MDPILYCMDPIWYFNISSVVKISICSDVSFVCQREVNVVTDFMWLFNICGGLIYCHTFHLFLLITFYTFWIIIVRKVSIFMIHQESLKRFAQNLSQQRPAQDVLDFMAVLLCSMEPTTRKVFRIAANVFFLRIITRIEIIYLPISVCITSLSFG